MPLYLIASYLPDDFDPSTVTEETVEAIHALNREIVAAGIEKFACGLTPPGNAKSLRKQRDGKVSVIDGPYIETKEHIGGLMVLEAASIEEALAWAHKGLAANGGQGAVEVREVLFFPDPQAATE